MKSKQKEKIKVFNDFINSYNSIGYGEARVIETKGNIIIELWNAGFSENEELESEFIKRKDIKYNLILDNHPSKVFLIQKISFLMSSNVTDDIFNPLRETKFYSIKRKYKYILDID